MTHMQTFKNEFEKEAVTTRKMLALVPNDKYDWKPHPKSMTIRQLTTHIADIFSWFNLVLNTSELDFASNPYNPEDISTTPALMTFFEKKLLEGRTSLAKGKDEQLDEIWTLRSGEHIHSADPKAEVIRMCFSQIIHHRAQLGVFLRLLEVPIPGSYGPSADDTNF
jgi:uncharacterized damage-inducible protein DinB